MRCDRAGDSAPTTSSRRPARIARTILLSGLDELTASERRVAQMAAEELSNKEIAQALFVTVKTVEQHLGRVYRKLDISSRRQLGCTRRSGSDRVRVAGERRLPRMIEESRARRATNSI